MKSKVFKSILSAFFLLLMFFSVSKVQADPAVLQTSPDLGVDYPAAVGLTSVDPRTTISKIIKVALSLIGTVFFLMIIYAGFLWLTAGGNEDAIGEAKKWIYGGIIGLIIILSSYALTNFVVNQLNIATTR